MQTENKIPEYHQQAISKFPANTWVKPYNGANSNDYQVFSDLYEWGLVRRKIEPVYTESRITGSSVYFMYN